MEQPLPVVNPDIDDVEGTKEEVNEWGPGPQKVKVLFPVIEKVVALWVE